MAKKITGYIKLQIPAGAATPAPPVGPALGQHGVNIMEFCKTFNARTPGTAGPDHPRGDHGLLRPHLHLHHQDAARGDPPAPRRRRAEGLRRAEQDQDRQGHAASRSKRSPAPRCRTSTPPASKPPSRPSRAPRARWASKSPSNVRELRFLLQLLRYRETHSNQQPTTVSSAQRVAGQVSRRLARAANTTRRKFGQTRQEVSCCGREGRTAAVSAGRGVRSAQADRIRQVQ